MEVKICTKCKESKELSQFNNQKTGIGGLAYYCRVCVNKTSFEQREKDREKYNNHIKKWQRNNKEKEALRKRKWKQDNREKVISVRKKRELALKRASFNNEILKGIVDSIYDNCPKGMAVDHYYPIQGKLVSGLNVPWNIQYLTISENRSKYNKMPIEPIKDNLPNFIKAEIAEYLEKV